MSLPQDPAARKAIKKCLEEISASMTRTEGERDFIKVAISNDNFSERLVQSYSNQLELFDPSKMNRNIENVYSNAGF